MNLKQNKKKMITVAVTLLYVINMSIFQSMGYSIVIANAASVNEESTEQNSEGINYITIDGEKANTNSADEFQGFGCVTANNSSRLLLDYKQENKKAYWEIMNYLFNKNYGAGLSYIKVELGSDVNSSSGTEPSSMRSAEEEPDVTRGAGWIFAADAKKINADIKVDALRWSQPAWVDDAFETSKEAGYEARYKWYKETINKVYDVYKLKLDYLSADQNETAKVEPEWIIYLKDHLEEDSQKEGAKYDYSRIKIVASDEVGSTNIADQMISNTELRDAIDAVGTHYTTKASNNMVTLNDEYDKQIFYSEGGSPTTQAKYKANADGSGLTGVNGALDIANRFINSYTNGSMTLYEYQPAVASYYEGAKYYPKQLISAYDPWSGYYNVDIGIWMTAHFMQFTKTGWQYIDGACYGDGKEATAIYSDTSTNNYLTLMDPKTQDYTMILTNDSNAERKYKLTIKNLKKGGSNLNMWQSIGPNEGEHYDANWFKNIGQVAPTDNGDGTYTIEFTVKPYSILTLTSLLDKGKMGITDQIDESKREVLKLPYYDNFEYQNYNKDYLSSRGNVPRYTTDQGGAFEVKKENNNNVLEQMITEQLKPTDWRYRYTVNPYTVLGDNRWANYSVSMDFKLDDSNKTDSNYEAIGGRHLTTTYSDNYANSGYSVVVKGNGNWQLLDIKDVVANGTLQNFDITAWHNVKVQFIDNVVTAYFDGKLLTTYMDDKGISMTGKVSIASAYFNNKYDNLKIEPIKGYAWAADRIDDFDSSLSYLGNWDNAVNTGYNDYNRTASTGIVDSEENESKSGETSVSYIFKGTGFNVVGRNSKGVVDIYVDNKLYRSDVICENVGDRQASIYVNGLGYGKHNMKVLVKSGMIKVDAVETLGKVYN